MKKIRLQMSDKLKIKTGDIAEFYFPHNVELSTLYGIRGQIFNSNSLQELLDKVQERLTKLQNEEIRKVESYEPNKPRGENNDL
jgi:hypothetical protein|tara:strand:- start:118 stop:369 length:252 start_codon:yes stop_codon:yes gene_type:complete